MTIDHRIPTLPGRSTSGFYRPGRHGVHQARIAVRCSASRIKGELHPTKNHVSGGLPHLVRTCMSDDCLESFFVFSGVANFSPTKHAPRAGAGGGRADLVLALVISPLTAHPSRDGAGGSPVYMYADVVEFCRCAFWNFGIRPILKSTCWCFPLARRVVFSIRYQGSLLSLSNAA